MRKIVLSFLVCVLFASCAKYQKQPVSYTVTNDAAVTGFYDVYIPDTGTYDLSVYVKFLSGYSQDSVKLVLTGLPTGITVAPDTISQVPTYNGDFIFSTKNMPHGVYPVTLTAYTPTQTVPRAYNFNLVVVPVDAASLFFGSISDSNACTARNYKYSATGSTGGAKNVLVINNFGGYGTNVNVNVFFNQQNGTLTIPSQICGNGCNVSGSGTFTETQMIINYTATSTPTNPAESCTSIYTN